MFDRGKSQTAKETRYERVQEKLYMNIGQLKVEVDFFKKKLREARFPFAAGIMILMGQESEPGQTILPVGCASAQLLLPRQPAVD